MDVSFAAKIESSPFSRFKLLFVAVRGQFQSETRTGVELDQSWLTGNQKRVTDRTWLQLMCCTHSYDMWVCPIISEQSSEIGAGQKSDRGWTGEIREESRGRELVGYKGVRNRKQ